MLIFLLITITRPNRNQNIRNSKNNETNENNQNNSITTMIFVMMMIRMKNTYVDVHLHMCVYYIYIYNYVLGLYRSGIFGVPPYRDHGGGTLSDIIQRASDRQFSSNAGLRDGLKIESRIRGSD